MSDAVMSQALRAYEVGRLRAGATRAAMVALLVALVSVMAVGRGALAWAVPLFLGLTLAEWRGGALSRGARRGALLGLVTLVLPMSVLRPCCDAAMLASGACCTKPSMCGVAGIVLGLAAALAWPREKTVRAHLVAGGGVALGALAVALVRCASLFTGEAVGLAIGLLAGITASACARAWRCAHAPSLQ